MIENLKIVLVGHGGAAVFLAAIDPQVVPLGEMLTWAGIISFIGGFSSEWRRTNEWTHLTKAGLSTAVLGMGIVFVASNWATEYPGIVRMSVGFSAILSLGGLATVDWLHNLLKKRLEKEIDD